MDPQYTVTGWMCAPPIYMMKSYPPPVSWWYLEVGSLGWFGHEWDECSYERSNRGPPNCPFEGTVEKSMTGREMALTRPRSQPDLQLQPPGPWAQTSAVYHTPSLWYFVTVARAEQNIHQPETEGRVSISTLERTGNHDFNHYITLTQQRHNEEPG